MQEGGADIIELGMPFSDPQADGATIQATAKPHTKQTQTDTKQTLNRHQTDAWVWEHSSDHTRIRAYTHMCHATRTPTRAHPHTCIHLSHLFTHPRTLCQATNQVALKYGTGIKESLQFVADARKRGLTAPVILMGYYNPILQVCFLCACLRARARARACVCSIGIKVSHEHHRITNH